MKILDWGYDIAKSAGFGEVWSMYINLGINLVLIAIAAYVLDRIFMKMLVVGFGIAAKRTKTTFDDFLVENKTTKYIAHLIPVIFIYNVVPTVLTDFTAWEYLFSKGMTIFIILIVLWIIRSLLNAIKDYLKLQPDYNDKPIDSYIQVIMIVLWIFGVTAMVMTLFNLKFLQIIGTFGAVSAVVVLIFKDTILGFVASIQVTVNDMVRIGDWITMEKYGADGHVIEINLATVKVQNFDHTTTTVPTYSLISDSFKNWRGMLNSEGRRIKRHILIKANSVRFIHRDEIKDLAKIQLISKYLQQRQSDIDSWNAQHGVDKSLSINGRNLTNLGIFRKYINSYIETHPGANTNLTIMCRHLQPTEKGIPIEIYLFTTDKRWLDHEYIMADIFDHVIASVAYFDLEIFELPSGKGYIEG